MHGYRYPAHEARIGAIARAAGFTQVSESHRTSPLMKLVSRGDTTVVDAYLSPILRRYVTEVARELQNVKLLFMQSNGGLTDAASFRGKDSIVSGPAGGIVGMARTAQTGRASATSSASTWAAPPPTCRTSRASSSASTRRRSPGCGCGRRCWPSTRWPRAAARCCTSTAAGTGWGPTRPAPIPGRPATGAAARSPSPTPTCCSAASSRTTSRRCSATSGDQPLDAEITRTKFAELSEQITAATGDDRGPEQVAAGFVEIAVANMANAIKKISVQRGYDVTGYVLNVFGGAGGQHACAVADALGMTRVLIHPLAGVLSAYGIGLADVIAMREQAVEAPLTADLIKGLPETTGPLEARRPRRGAGGERRTPAGSPPRTGRTCATRAPTPPSSSRSARWSR